jgi:hypothetical protein
LAVQLQVAREQEQFWKERHRDLEAKYEEANQGRIKSTETVADWMSQMRFGRKIYEHAPALPEKTASELQPIMKTRVQARMRVQERENEYWQLVQQERKAQLAKQQQPVDPQAAAEEFDQQLKSYVQKNGETVGS